MMFDNSMEWFPIILKIHSKTLTVAYKALTARHNQECISTCLVFKGEGGWEGTMMTKAL